MRCSRLPCTSVKNAPIFKQSLNKLLSVLHIQGMVEYSNRHSLARSSP